jgi:ABC-type cobalamin transport system ATPase subunit
MALPQKLSLDQMQTKWAAEIDLVVGQNIIDHKLGRALQGWTVTRKRAAASIYDLQDTNPHPSRTLILFSDAVVTIDLSVF